MTPEEITQGNKLIAEFMHYKMNEDGYYLIPYELPQFRGSDHGEWCSATNHHWEIHLQNLMYDFSWNWLMPVVEKIESLDKLGGIVTIIQGQCKIVSRALGDNTVYANKSNYMLMGVKGKLLSTWEAVIGFIKWYNEQKDEEN